LTKHQRELLEEFDITVGNPHYTLLIVFGVNDCSSCMTEKKYWNRVTQFDNVEVLAVGYHEFEDEFWKCIPNYGFNFEVLYDGKAVFKSLFTGAAKTPYKLLLKGDKIVYKEGPNMDSISQEAFFQRISEITQ
ncbi:hypothetical protein JXI42_04495, partial [bacterium]|nr:hypothetical protein [bacterium]